MGQGSVVGRSPSGNSSDECGLNDSRVGRFRAAYAHSSDEAPRAIRPTSVLGPSLFFGIGFFAAQAPEVAVGFAGRVAFFVVVGVGTFGAGLVAFAALEVGAVEVGVVVGQVGGAAVFALGAAVVGPNAAGGFGAYLGQGEAPRGQGQQQQAQQRGAAAGAIFPGPGWGRARGQGCRRRRPERLWVWACACHEACI